MILRQVHYEFWMARQKQPSWAKEAHAPKGKYASYGRSLQKLAEESKKGVIDRCINAHAGIRSTNGELAAGNLISFLRNHRGEMAGFLADLVAKNWLSPDHRRMPYAKKWLKRLGLRAEVMQLEHARAEATLAKAAARKRTS